MFIFKALIDSNISYDKYVLINNVLEDYDNMKKKKKKKEIKDLNSSWKILVYLKNNVIALFEVQKRYIN